MDLNPREAVVDQEPSHTSEQEEREPTQDQAMIVPEKFVGAAVDCLNRVAPGLKIVRGTACYYTNHRHDQCCGDIR